MCPSPAGIAALRIDKLSNLLSKASHGRFGRSSAEALTSLAKTSVGVKNPYISIQITQTIASIELLEQQIEEIETLIEDTMKELDSVIMTIPGIGAMNGAMILGEIGDISRFASASKLLTYAGLDPTVCQSGNFKARSTRMSKRGSKTLRFALINAAWQLTLHSDVFKAYYELKRPPVWGITPLSVMSLTNLFAFSSSSSGLKFLLMKTFCELLRLGIDFS